MKLHLPKSLRAAVLACLAVAGGISSTVGSGFVAGGALTFALAAVPQAQADPAWTDATLVTGNGDFKITYNEETGKYSIKYGDSTLDSGALDEGSADVYLTLAQDVSEVTASTLVFESGAYNDVRFFQAAPIKGDIGTADERVALTLTVSGDTSITSFGGYTNGLLNYSGSLANTRGQMYLDMTVNVDTTGSIGHLNLTGRDNAAGWLNVHGNLVANIKAAKQIAGLGLGVKFIQTDASVTYNLGELNAADDKLVFTGDITGGIVDEGEKKETITKTKISGPVSITLNSGTFRNVYGVSYASTHSGVITITYNGGTISDGCVIAGIEPGCGATVTGACTLNVGGTLATDKVLLNTFTAINVLSGGTLNLNGDLALPTAIQNSGTVNLNGATQIDLSALTPQDGVYTLVAGGTITDDQLESKFSADMLLGVITSGKNWSYADGVITSVEQASVVYTGGSLNWAVGTEFPTGGQYQDGINVKFNTADAQVTLGSNVAPGAVFVEGVTVTMTGGDYKLSSPYIVVDGTLRLKDSVLDDSSVVTTTDTGSVVIDGNVTIGSQLDQCFGHVTVADGATLTLTKKYNGEKNSISIASGKLGTVCASFDENATGHGKGLQLGDDFHGTLVLNKGNFNLSQFVVAPDATVRLEGGQDWSSNETFQHWSNGGSFTANIHLAGESVDSFNFRNSNTFELKGNVSGSFLTLGWNGDGKNNKGSETTGVLKLSGSENNVQTVTVDHASLIVAGDSTFGTLSQSRDGRYVSVENAASLSLAGASEVTDLRMSSGTTLNLNNGATLKAAKLTNSGSVTIGGNGAMTVSGAATLAETYVAADSSVVVDGAVTANGLHKLGAGSLTINGATIGGKIVMNYEGTLLLGEGTEVSSGTVLSYIGGDKVLNLDGGTDLSTKGWSIELGNVEADELESGISLGIIYTGELEAAKTALGLTEGSLSLDAQNVLSYKWEASSDAKALWDANWGMELMGAPTGLNPKVIGAEETNVGLYAEGTTPTAYALSGGSANAVVYGGDKNTATAQHIQTDVWLNVQEGIYGKVIGGNHCADWKNTKKADFTGDTHIKIGGTAVIDTVIGGNYKDADGSAFVGNSYISLYDGAQVGAVIGSFVNAHSGSNHTGDTNIFVYTALENVTMADQEVLGNSIVGSVAMVASAPRTAQQFGNTSITIAPTAADATIAKSIIGGAYVKYGSQTAIISGTSSINISGGNITSDVVGGTYHVDASTSSITGGTKVNISGGIFSKINVVGGTYVQGGNANVSVDSVTMNLTGGALPAVNTEGFTLIGGLFIGTGNNVAVTASVGDIDITFDQAAGKTLTAGNIIGGSRSWRKHAGSTISQGNITVSLLSGSIGGNIYAAGSQMGDTKLTAASTRVEIGEGISNANFTGIGSGGDQTISGGYEFGANMSGSTVTGDRTLAFTGTADISGVTVKDFDVIEVAEGATGTIDATRLGSLTDNSELRKEGSGTLSLLGSLMGRTLNVTEGRVELNTDKNIDRFNTASHMGSFAIQSGASLAIGEDISLSSGGLILHSGSTLVFTGKNALDMNPLEYPEEYVDYLAKIRLGGEDASVSSFTLNLELAEGFDAEAGQMLFANMKKEQINIASDAWVTEEGCTYVKASDYLSSLMVGTDTKTEKSLENLILELTTDGLVLREKTVPRLYWEDYGSTVWNATTTPWSRKDGDPGSLEWVDKSIAVFSYNANAGEPTSSTITIGSAITVDSLIVDAKNVEGVSYTFSASEGSGSLSISNLLEVKNKGTATFNFAPTFGETAAISVAAGSTLKLADTNSIGSVVNHGTMTLTGDYGSLLTSGDVENSGNLTGYALYVGGYMMDSHAVLTNSGDGTITVGYLSAYELNNTGGVISITGNFPVNIKNVTAGGVLSAMGGLTLESSAAFTKLTAASVTMSGDGQNNRNLELGNGSSITGALVGSSDIPDTVVGIGTLSIKKSAAVSIGSMTVDALNNGGTLTISGTAATSIGAVTAGGTLLAEKSAVTLGGSAEFTTLSAASVEMSATEAKDKNLELGDGSEITGAVDGVNVFNLAPPPAAVAGASAPTTTTVTVGTLTANTVTIETNEKLIATESVSGAVTMTGGTLETSGVIDGAVTMSDGKLSANKVTGTGAVSITGGKITLQDDTDAFANTGTTTISGATLAGTWTASGVTIGGPSTKQTTIAAGADITLKDATLTHTLNNLGTLTLSGTINLASGFTTVKQDTSWSDGTNGFATSDTLYLIVNSEGNNLPDATGVTSWKVNDAAIAAQHAYDKGVLRIKGTDWGTVYYVTTGPLSYAEIAKTNAQGEALTGVVMNGGTLDLDVALGTGVGITVKKASIVNVVAGITLNAASVTSDDETKSLSLTGSGIYALKTGDSALASGVKLAVGAVGADGADVWTGTVQVTGATISNLDLDLLANGGNSIVALSGVEGSLSGATYEAKLQLTDAANARALKLTGGGVHTFGGVVNGTGTLEIGGDAETSTTFTGDTSAWTGAVIASSTADTKLEFNGSTSIGTTVQKNGTGALNVTIANANAATVTVNGAITASSLTMGAAGDATTEYTVTNSVDVTDLTILKNTTFDYTDTTERSLAVTGKLTTNAITELKQDLTLAGQLAGTGSLAGTALTLQGATNEVGALTLSNGLTLGTANAASKLKVGTLSVGGALSFNSLVANQVEVVDKLDNNLNLSISEELLLTQVAQNGGKLALMTITNQNGKQISLNGENMFTSQDGQYSYVLDITNNVLTISSAAEGTRWNGTDGENGAHDWKDNDSWEGNDAPTDGDSVVFDGRGCHCVEFSSDASIRNLTIAVEEDPNTEDDVVYTTGYVFNGDASLSVTYNLSVNSGSLTLSGVDVNTADRTEVLANGVLTIVNGEYTNATGATEVTRGSLSARNGIKNDGELNILRGGALQVSNEHTETALYVGLQNNGTLVIAGGGEVQVGGALMTYHPDSSITNTGTIRNACKLSAGGDIKNSGVIYSGHNPEDPASLEFAANNQLQTFGSFFNTGANIKPADDGTVEAGLTISRGKENKIGRVLCNEQVVNVTGEDTVLTVGGVDNSSNAVVNVSAATMNVTGYKEIKEDYQSYIVPAKLANSGTLNIVDGAKVAVSYYVEDDGMLLADGDGATDMGTPGLVVNTGTINIGTAKGATVGAMEVQGDVDNSGTMTVNTGSTLTVSGKFDNVGGTLTLADGATASIGKELVIKDDSGTGTLFVGSGATLTVGGNLAADSMVLTFGGDVTVGGDVKIGTLTNNGVFTANGSPETQVHIDTLDNNGTLSVGMVENNVLTGGHLDVGKLSGNGAVNVGTGGSLNIGEATTFTGQLNNLGTLNIETTTLSSAQQSADQTAGNIIATDLTVTADATGFEDGSYKLGNVKTDTLTIENIAAASPSARLEMTSLAANEGSKVKLVLSEIESGAVTSGSYHLISLETPMTGGIGAEFDLSNYGYNEQGEYDAKVVSELQGDYMQNLLQKNQYVTFSDVDPNAAVALLAGGTKNVYVSITELTDELSVWKMDGAHNMTEAGLTVLDANDKLVSDTILDNVQTVQVTDTQTLDLTGTRKSVKLNNLTAVSSEAAIVEKLIVRGDGSAIDSATITSAANGYAGHLDLAQVKASLKGKADSVTLGDDTIATLGMNDTAIKVAGSDITLGGEMTGGSLNFGINSDALGREIIGGDLELKGSAINVKQEDSNILLNLVGTEVVELANLGSTKGTATVTLNGDGLNKYFTNARFEGGKVVADRNMDYVADAIEATSDNGVAGASMLDDALVYVNPQVTKPDGDLAALLNAVDAGEMTDDDAAAVAGASVATLGMALSGDVERQLKAIRNRTTTMGVNECVVNEGMPYFNAWVNAEGNRAELDKDGTAAGYVLDSWGGTVGFDVDCNENLSMGLAITAMYGDLDSNGADRLTGDMDTTYVSLFARYATCGWTHTFVGTLGKMDGSYERTVNAGAGYTTEGDMEGTSFGLMYEVGYVVPLTDDATACLQPVFNVMLRHSVVDSYTEDGRDAALEVGEQTMTSLTFGLGSRLQAVVGESIYNRASLLEARVLVKADVGDRSSEADVTMLGGNNGASVESAELGAFGIEVGAGLSIPLGDDDGSIFIDGSYEFRSGYSNVNGTVGYRVNF